MGAAVSVLLALIATIDFLSIKVRSSPYHVSFGTIFETKVKDKFLAGIGRISIKKKIYDRNSEKHHEVQYNISIGYLAQ